jgi:hypothetical protein
VENNWIGLLDMALQYYLHIDASALSDAEWCEKIAQLSYLRTQERKASEKPVGWRSL